MELEIFSKKAYAAYAVFRSGELRDTGSTDSTKGTFLAKFCLEGKKILRVTSYFMIEFKEDELDKEVIKVSRHIPASKSHVWNKALDILKEKGREEALEYLRAVAVSIGLRDG